MAYSLFYAFKVNFPLIYNKGANAFLRLQLKLIQSSPDESIFVRKDERLWTSKLLAQSR